VDRKQQRRARGRSFPGAAGIRLRPDATINHQTAVVAPVTAEELQAARQKLIEAQAHTDRREPREASAVNLKVE
jgi:hypothetical protein